MRNARSVSLSERVYGALLHATPREFYEEYSDEMRQFFVSQMERARRTSRFAQARLWARAFTDIATTAGSEHLVALKRKSTPAHQAAKISNNTRNQSMLTSLLQDARYAVRSLRKNPVFTAVAVLVVGLGSGAVSTMFSVANSIVLRPLPGVRDAHNVMNIERTRADGSGSLSASYAYYEDLAAHTKKMSGIAAWTMLEMTVSSGGQGVNSLGNLVSGNYFDVLGVRPVLGRFFQGEETRVQGKYPVVVISHEFWRRQFAGDSGVIGRQLIVNGTSFTVIGVAPNRFSGLFSVLRTDAWVPLMMQSAVRRGGDLLSNSNASWLELVGRVRDGVSPIEAQVELSSITKQRTSDAGEPAFMTDYAGAKVSRATGLPSDAAGAVTAFLLVLVGVAGLVLVIASVNVASMLLARAIARRREIAVRIALGAGRARLVGQLITESVILFGLGGALGTLFAVFGTRALQQIELPVDVPIALDASPDFRVLVVTLSVALLTGIVFGLAPAFRASRAEIAGTLRNDSAAAGKGRSKLRNTLVVGQVAVSLLLLTVSGLFLRALDKGRRVELGMNVENIATAALNVGTAGYDSVRGKELYRNLREKLENQPGISNVAYAGMLPLSMNSTGQDISIPGYVPPNARNGTEFAVLTNTVDGNYFAVTQIPFLVGRAFEAKDDAAAPAVVVVNEAFASTYWPGRSAIGQTIDMDGRSMTVVGVVKDSRYNKLNEGKTPFIFLPIAQHWRSNQNILVRTTGDATNAMQAIRRELKALDPNLPDPTLTTLRKATAVVLLPQRVAVMVTAALGFLGLILAGIGLYGVISFSAAQRTREIGVRVALGAAKRDVLRMVIGEGMALVGAGMVLGTVLSVAATRVLTSFLFGVSPVDILTFVATGGILAATALFASYLPARRAATVDPMLALRQE